MFALHKLGLPVLRLSSGFLKKIAPTRVSRFGRLRSSVAALKVVSVDLLKQDNQPKHNTSEYEVDELVVRRGSPFTLMLTLSRALTEDESLQFELRMVTTSRRSSVNHGPLVRLPKINPKPDENLNGHKVAAASGDILTIEVHTSADIGIGQWRLAVHPYRNDHGGLIQTVTDDIIVIFNPWHKKDQVYMPDATCRNEYVLNEDGMQFSGSSHRIDQMHWYFGQFESVVLKARLRLLNMGYPRYEDHSDAVMVSRHMSGLVNANDDMGVIVGKWSGDYEENGSKSPNYWNGSVAILKEFYESQRPVRYGQCWVFSGVLTTVLRCLGIPARSVTTFNSAHDTDGNLTIDYHYDENGKPMNNYDSIWNFHVWNDAWMARPLLPEGYGGWQAVDATPQEESGGKMQCGPASVIAVKEGQINHPYDAPFVYAEVNGMKRYWQKLKKAERDEGGKLIEWELIGSETDQIGQNLSTKAIGSYKREDLTLQYKYAEGTPEEAFSFEHARKYVKFTKVPQKEIPKVVEFQPHASGAVQFGNDVTIRFRVKNISKKSQKVFLSMVGNVMQYNGVALSQMFDQDFTKEIRAGKTEEFDITIPYKSYASIVRGNNSIKVACLGGVRLSKQTFAGQSIVDFEKPAITIEAPSSVKLLKPVKVKVSFTNPLSVSLERGEFRLEGAGVKEAVVVMTSTVRPFGVCNADVTIIPRKVGSRRIIAGFSSSAIDGVRGSVDITVE